ncbi:hypothetical protein QO004_002042 [Rhizobium mesoamericanum]|uniref:hypothetical protein n=1 Tax=Rhizobium mesoamericanum TaxID=1079800 RepID=UPI00278A17A5|nr:hypothetical protein [Rhizobium mesoamericanum]MDQ0560260.1 hypothetical protein [Rhizobium mesoamericanum]
MRKAARGADAFRRAEGLSRLSEWRLVHRPPESGYIVTIFDDPAHFGVAGVIADDARRLLTCVRRNAGQARLYLKATPASLGRVRDKNGWAGRRRFNNGLRQFDRPWVRHRTYNWPKRTFDGAPPVFNDNGE